jgi:hypothetical protein
MELYLLFILIILFDILFYFVNEFIGREIQQMEEIRRR